MRQGYLNPTIIIILALITLGVAATLIFNAKLFLKPKPSPTPISQSSPLLSPSPLDETADWKTYISKKKTFNFQYPPRLTIYEEKSDSNGEVVTVSVNEEPTTSFTIRTEVYTTIGIPCQEDEKAGKVKYLGNPTGVRITKTITGTELCDPLRQSVEGQLRERQWIIQDNSRRVLIIVTYDGSDKGFQETNQILSTFQFLE